MKLNSLLRTFIKVTPARPHETTVRFVVNDEKTLSVKTVLFDVEENAWTVSLHMD